ncbi:MAG TPA: DUF1648 domain-containing protein [Nitrospirota bacterium]
MRNLSRIIFIIILLLGLVQAVYYYPLLPDRVASHFGVSGNPDAWSSKDSFMKIYGIAILVVAVLFSGIGFLLRKAPTSLINLPNKAYWLSPEQRDETVDGLSRQFLWPGSATLLLIQDIFHQAFNVQLGRAQTLEHPIASIVVYAVFTIIWNIALIAKFKRVP